LSLPKTNIVIISRTHLAFISFWLLFVLCPYCLAQQSQSMDSTQASAHIEAVVTPIPQNAIPAGVSNVKVIDRPDDAGSALTISWTLSPDDAMGKIKHYRILRAVNQDGKPGDFSEVGTVQAGTSSYNDGGTGTRTGFWDRIIHSVDKTSFFYKVIAINDSSYQGTTIWELTSESEVAGPASSVAQWFDNQRKNVLVGVLILCFLILFYISRARAGKEIFIRKIAGLDAVNDAVGRATEMGKKVFFIPGSSDMDNVQTLAGITILGHVAELTAQYETSLQVPVSRSLVMVACREIVKEAYVKAGRPDSFKEDQVHYLTDDQFGYAAAIDGMVVREKPAAIFLLGNFYGEALILAETGNAAGAIQIAGTGEPSQLPFFVAACDFTLIGEELFAASAYLSREPRQLGSLKGQDIGKGLILIAIIVGLILETAYLWDFSQYFKVIE
jgi:hypothetical protein